MIHQDPTSSLDVVIGSWNDGRVDIRKLEVFTTVAEERSFTRAAEKLHTAQSGVSTAIRALERDLGASCSTAPLSGFELTEAGRALLPEALRILAAVESARETVTQVGQGLRGRLRLGFFTGSLRAAYARRWSTFRAELPAVEMWLTAPGQRGTLDHLDLLRDGALDVAMVLTHGPVPGIDQRVLATDEVVLVCHPRPPAGRRRPVQVDLTEVADETFIEFPPGWGVRSTVDQAFARRRPDRADHRPDQRPVDDRRPGPAGARRRVRAALGRRRDARPALSHDPRRAPPLIASRSRPPPGARSARRPAVPADRGARGQGVHGRSFSGLRTAQMCLIRSPAIVEREHRHGDAVLLGHQAGLAVDRALQERRAVARRRRSRRGTGDLLAALDRVQERDWPGRRRRRSPWRRGRAGRSGRRCPWPPRPLEVPDDRRPARRSGAAGVCAVRMRRRADEASWRQAAGVRPTISATSAKG